MLLEFENQEFWTSLTPSEPLTRLYTPNGRQLYIDLASGHVRHGDKGATDPEVFFLGAPAQSDDRSQGWLVYVDKGALQPITRLEDGVCGASFQQETGSWVAPTLLQAVPLERGLAAFRGEGLFLCADGNGSVTLSRSVCSAWEVFLPEFNLFADFDGAKRLHFDQQIERAAIAKVLIDPSVRARVWGASEKKKIVFFGPTQWSNGRVYCDLCKHLHEYGYIADLLNYREGHGHNIDLLLNYYDLFVCGLEDAMHVLVDIYGVPFEKIVGVSHWTFDIQAFIERYGRESFSKLAGYGVVGNTLLWDSLTLGVTRLPKIVPLGVNYDEFYSKPPTGLTTVGTASSLSAKNRYGVEIKRGHLSQEAAREAGLIFKPAGFWSGHYTPIHDMPDYYRSVDAILVPSLTEAGGPMPATEAAAAGRLVISTPVGVFPQRAYEGMGIMGPLEEDAFRKFAIETLVYYKNNPSEFVEKCSESQAAAKKSDWKNMIHDWVALIETSLAGMATKSCA